MSSRIVHTITAVALLTPMAGCSAKTEYAPAVLTPPKVEQSAQPKTVIDGLEGRPIGLSNQEPIPLDEARSASSAGAGASVPATNAGAAPVASGAAGKALESLIPKAPPELAVSAAAAAAASLPPGEKFDENNPKHRLARCRAHVARSEWFDAINDCRKSAELDATSAEPWVELMRIYVTIQSYADGTESARAVLARTPDSAPAYYYLGWSLSGGQDYPASIAAFQKAVSLDPRRVEYHQGLGITWCLTENFARGIAALEEAQRLDPGNAKTKALLDETRSLLADRLAQPEKAVKAKPNDATAHAMLGSKYQQYGFSQKALNEYDAAIANIPSPVASQDGDTRRLAAALQYNRGVLLRELGRGEPAIAAFTRSFEIDASLAPQAWYFIGLIAYDKGDNDGAIRALGKSVQGAPKVIENRKALALAYERAGNAAAAKQQRDEVALLERHKAELSRPPAEPALAPGLAPAAAPAGAGTAPPQQGAGSPPAAHKSFFDDAPEHSEDNP